ncbi:MAG: hypothetical protein WC011_00900 [Candidatus Paceibacterota bacterium]
MEPSTASPLGDNFAQELINILITSIEEKTKWAVNFAWDIFIAFLVKNWLPLFILLFFVLIITTFNAMMGRWGAFGSFAYNILYFTVLLIIGLIWGPEVFVDDVFNAACIVILYPVCYRIVGLILRKANFKN